MEDGARIFDDPEFDDYHVRKVTESDLVQVVEVRVAKSGYYLWGRPAEGGWILLYAPFHGLIWAEPVRGPASFIVYWTIVWLSRSSAS